jgi:hypothetical protein
MAGVIFHQTGGSLPFQAPGTVIWTLSGPWGGNRDHHFGYAARPFQANNTATLQRVTAAQDNNLVNTTDLTVTVASTSPGINGTLLKITAVQVTP